MTLTRTSHSRLLGTVSPDLPFRELAFFSPGVVPNGTWQTGILLSVFVVDLIVLLYLRPFSNSFIQWVETVSVSE